jgi:hypothetical protein
MCAVSSRACGRGHLGAVVPAAGTPPRRRGRRCSNRPPAGGGGAGGAAAGGADSAAAGGADGAAAGGAAVGVGAGGGADADGGGDNADDGNQPARRERNAAAASPRIMSCQGYYPSKPTPHASVYHSIACALAKVIFLIEFCNIPRGTSSLSASSKTCSSRRRR